MENDDYSVAKFYTNLWLNAAIGGTAFVSFCILRRFGPSSLRRFFNPYPRKAVEEQPSALSDEWGDASLVTWIWRVLTLREDTVYGRHGEDGVMYLRFIRLNFVLSLMMMLTGCAVILPVNITGGDSSDRQDMGVLTMSNIHERSDRFVVHIIFTYVYSFLFYLAIAWTFKQYVAIRIAYFASRSVRAFTLLLRNIPADLLGKGIIRRWFESRLNSSVVAVNFVWKSKLLESLLKKREKARLKWEKAEISLRQLAAFTNDTGQFPEIEGKAEALKRTVEDLDQEIARIQQDKSRNMKKTGAGFVTLSTPVYNRMRIVAFADPTSMTITPAPNPTDVNWKQLRTGYVSHVVRMLVITATLLVVSLGWTIPQTFLISLAHLSSLQDVSGLGWVTDYITSGITPTGAGILEGFIPAVVISLLLVLVKNAFKLAYTRFAGLSCYSVAEWYAMIMYSFFLFLNVFLAVAVEGTFFQTLADIIDDPSQMVTLLADSLPQQALFFTVFIMVQGMGRLPFQLFRFFSLLVRSIHYVILSRPITPHEKRKLLMVGEFDYVSGYSNGLLIFTITLCYSVMAPLTSVFGFIYFAISLLVDGYNLLIGTEQKRQGGGKAFSFVLQHFMLSVIVFQLLMIGVLGISQYAGGVALVPLPVLTAGLWFVLNYGWSHIVNYGPVDSASEMRLRDCVSEERMMHAYRQPGLGEEALELKEEEFEQGDIEKDPFPDTDEIELENNEFDDDIGLSLQEHR